MPNSVGGVFARSDAALWNQFLGMPCPQGPPCVKCGPLVSSPRLAAVTGAPDTWPRCGSGRAAAPRSQRRRPDGGPVGALFLAGCAPGAEVWLVTGWSRGLGRTSSEAVIAAGDPLVATARRTGDLDGLVERGDGRVIAVRLDVTDVGAAEAAAAAAAEQFGGLDVVVNNAGYGTLGSIEETPHPDLHHRWTAGSRVRRGCLRHCQARSRGLLRGTRRGDRSAGREGDHRRTRRIQTDWAGSSMAVVELGEDYGSTVGYMIGHLKDAGPPPGDPVKAAAVVVHLAGMAEPPLRLPLGSDAVQLIRAADEAKLVEIARWEDLSTSTDAENATARDVSRI
jgi:short subunit dehydrogenase